MLQQFLPEPQMTYTRPPVWHHTATIFTNFLTELVACTQLVGCHTTSMTCVLGLWASLRLLPDTATHGACQEPSLLAFMPVGASRAGPSRSSFWGWGWCGFSPCSLSALSDTACLPCMLCPLLCLLRWSPTALWLLGMTCSWVLLVLLLLHKGHLA